MGYRQNSLDYQGTHAVTGKHRLVHKFFAKYMLQIGYLTYCTTVNKFYLHLFVFSFVHINKLNTLWSFICFVYSLSDIFSGLPKYQAGQCDVT